MARRSVGALGEILLLIRFSLPKRRGIFDQRRHGLIARLAFGDFRPDAFSKAAGSVAFGNVASLRTQVSRTTFKVRLGASQREGPTLLFHPSHRFRIGHRAARIGAMRPGKFG